MTWGALGAEARQANPGQFKGVFGYRVKRFGLCQEGMENPLKEYEQRSGITVFVF